MKHPEYLGLSVNLICSYSSKKQTQILVHESPTVYSEIHPTFSVGLDCLQILLHIFREASDLDTTERADRFTWPGPAFLYPSLHFADASCVLASLL